MEGTCLCGAITITINDLEPYSRSGIFLCHCKNCKKTASSAFGTNLIIENYATTSGKYVKRHFCKTCGSPIQSLAESLPGKTILKIGIFEKVMVPEWECFAKDRYTWVPAIEGATQFKSKTGGEEM
ncbi:hypothetical protein DID88_002991 [Monilinia fructigena]|uniref:CENP-V/GFA domain-containing protein n=1 Tax=Monilinia fructigena TaxID=38457 RepID=A0A395IE82_9HELO|nr:hypothetical protein DID88_002991 [Monilinia fructigena]